MLAAAKATGDNRYSQYALQRMLLLADAAPQFDSLHRAGQPIDKLMRMVVDPHALDDCGAVCTAMIKARLMAADSALTVAADMTGRMGALDWTIGSYSSFLLNRQYRLPDGTFARTRPQYNTVWLDDMFMGIPAVAWMGRLRGDSRLYDEAAAMVHSFAERMFVPQRGLFRHGWVESMQPHPAFFWGRANGWALLTLCEVLDALPANHAGRQELLELLRIHIDALSQLQGIDGYWHQLLDRPETYNETSCTAIFTYCIAHAINEGWVDGLAYGPVAQLGWHAVERAVNAKGQVEGVCVGTGMGFDAAFYAYRPVHPMAAHGYGTTLWAGAEMIRLLQRQHPKLNDSAVHFYHQEIKTDAPIFSVDGETDF
jgi:rhamnogalacturonyl hydrolase YesR